MRKRNKFKINDLKLLCDGKPYSLIEVQNRLLEMMISFDSFCRLHNLKYFLAGGTLLGAVRHKGFIPWDDDIDVFMPRSDYEKFITYKKVNDDIDIIVFSDDKGFYHPYPYCNLADKKTIMIENNARFYSGKGQFLDIFPLDEVPEVDSVRKKFYKSLKFLKYKKGLQNNMFRKITSFKNLLFNIGVIFSLPYNEIKICKKIDSKAKMYFNTNSKLVAQLMVGETEKQTFPIDIFKELIELEFEGHLFYAPRKYDQFLKIQYGDYMKLPPKSEQVCHHGVELFNRIIK